MDAAKQNLLGLSLTELTQWCTVLGQKPFRAQQLLRWMHQEGCADFADMSNLAKAFRLVLEEQACVKGLPVVYDKRATDGTRKWLFDVGAGDAIETVFIPEERRGTLCISSQAGCAVNCRFCSTGHQGFSRNLSSAEIVAQLWYANRELRGSAGVHDAQRPVTNVVMMGMGEPLLNYHALLPALQVMLDDHAYGLSRRRLTVSTSGVVPYIDRLAQDCPVALAVSLHAPTDALRDQLVPLNKKYPLRELLQACLRYLKVAPRDFITFEYVMLDGVNDTAEHVQQLLAVAREVPCKLNLIPFNPFPGSGLKQSKPQAIARFVDTLNAAGVVATVRKTRGDDIDAACGQLAGEVNDRTDVQKRRHAVLPIHAVRFDAQPGH